MIWSFDQELPCLEGFFSPSAFLSSILNTSESDSVQIYHTRFHWVSRKYRTTVFPYQKWARLIYHADHLTLNVFFSLLRPRIHCLGPQNYFFVWYQVNQSVGSYMGWTTSIAMRWWLEKWCPKIETCHTDFLLVKMTRCIWDRLYALFVPITDLKKWTQINQPGDS